MCLLFLWHHDQLLILIRIFVREKEMNMKRIYWLFLATLVILAQYSCGSEDKTYGEQKEQEREVVSSFIKRDVVMMIGTDTLLDLGKIKVITEEEFEDTLKLIERVGYDALFTFIYSPRKGTPAAEMEDQIPAEVKSELEKIREQIQNIE